MRCPLTCGMPGRNERGAALTEFAIVFPVQLFVVLGIIQLALAYGAQQVVEYSSYAAARAGIVNGPDPNKAKEEAVRASQLALLPVTWAPLSDATDADALTAEVKATGGSQWEASKTQTTALNYKAYALWGSTVDHSFMLKIPVVDVFLSGSGESALLPWTEPGPASSDGSAPTSGG